MRESRDAAESRSVPQRVAGGPDTVPANTTEKERVGVGIARFDPVNALAQVIGKPAVVTGGIGIRIRTMKPRVAR